MVFNSCKVGEGGGGWGGKFVPPTIQTPVKFLDFEWSNNFALFGRITFKLGKFPYVNALFPEVSMDNGLRLFIKSRKRKRKRVLLSFWKSIKGSLITAFPAMRAVSLWAWRSVAGRHIIPGWWHRKGVIMRITVHKVNSMRPQRTTDRWIWRPGYIMKAIIKMARIEVPFRRQMPSGAKSLNRLQP